MRNDRQAYAALRNNETRGQKAKRIMAQPQSFAFRLGALIASDTNKGKVW